MRKLLSAFFFITSRIALVSNSLDLVSNPNYGLLFISYQFVKGFLAITFYYLLFLAETLMICVNDSFI